MSFCILGKYAVAKFNNTLFLDYYTGWDGERYSIIKVILTFKGNILMCPYTSKTIEYLLKKVNNDLKAQTFLVKVG